MKFENVQEVERSVPSNEFRMTMQARELDAEFRLLRKLTETKEHLQNQEQFDKKASSKLNRYAELKPCKCEITIHSYFFCKVKHTRVRLMQRNEDIHDSYINANYVNSSLAQNDQLFIATQGPLENTAENFWRMVDQENLSLIVMLTATKEHGRTKCHQYWPNEVKQTADGNDCVVFDIDKVVSLISVEQLMPNLIKRKFEISNPQGISRVVTQLQYLTWPDHGAPEEQDFKIIESILDYMKEFHLTGEKSKDAGTG